MATENLGQKCVALLMGRADRSLMPVGSDIEDLGVVVESMLIFAIHISRIVAKVYV